MSPTDRRTTLALLLAASLIVGTLVVGAAAGQTATEPEPTDTPAGTETPVDTETPGVDETEATPTGPGTGTPAVTGTPAGTPGAGTYDQDTSFLRVAHVSPDAPAVDVYLDGERVLNGFQFGEVSDYLALDSGNHSVRITPADENDTTVFSGNVTLEPRSATTLFAAGEVGENATEPFAPILFEDDPFVPAEDEAAVSVAHMSPDAPAVDVTAANGSVVLADDLSFREASQYETVPAGNYTLEVRPATETNDGPVVATANVSLEGGTAYSAIAIGYANANETADGEALQVTLVEDASKTIHLPAAGGDGAGANETPEGTPTTVTPGTETTEGVGTETVEGTETTAATEEPTETVEG